MIVQLYLSGDHLISFDLLFDKLIPQMIIQIFENENSDIILYVEQILKEFNEF